MSDMCVVLGDCVCGWDFLWAVVDLLQRLIFKWCLSIIAASLLDHFDHFCCWARKIFQLPGRSSEGFLCRRRVALPFKCLIDSLWPSNIQFMGMVIANLYSTTSREARQTHYDLRNPLWQQVQLPQGFCSNGFRSWLLIFYLGLAISCCSWHSVRI